MNDKRKCPKHNYWMRKGQCEQCILAAEKLKRENEKTGGRNSPPIVVGTTDRIGKH